MNKNLLFLLLFLISHHTSAQTGPHVPEMEILDNNIQDFMEQWNIPGASLAVAKNGRLVYARGFGYADYATEEVVTPGSRFRIASISKPLTSTAIFQLIESGQLSLTDQVFGEDGILNDAYFLPLQDEALKNITVKHLLTHTGGWTGSGQLNVDPMFSPLIIAQAMAVSPPAEPNDIVAYMTTKKDLDFTAGTQVEYANFGYCVLGRIIEKISGKDYESYLQENVFAGLNAPSFSIAGNLQNERQEDEVVYYHPTNTFLPSCYGTGEQLPSQYGGIYVPAMDAHGGWIASATDLLRFALAVDGKATRPDILNPTSIQTMRTQGFAGSNFGHGWTLYNGGVYHFGLLPGATGELDINTNGDIAFAVLLNSNSFNGQFLNALDGAIWSGISQITNYPNHDFFDGFPSSTNHIKNSLDITVAPNPSADAFNISWPDEAEVLSVLDINGKLLLSKQLSKSNRFFSLDLINHPAGTYFLKIQNGNQVYSKKLIKL